MRTLDGLENWEAVYTKEANPGRWTSIGLDVTTTYGVHFDPFHKNRIFITYTDIGLFRSEDGGISWMSSTEQGVPRRWVNTTYWMEFDPEVEGRVWAVASGIHDLPRPKMWRNQPVSNYNGGILLSEDGGISWIPAEGIPQTAATHIILDPDSPVNARILYVAGFGTGVFKSMDGGKSWELRNTGLPEKEPFAWQLTRDNQGALYLVIARRSTDDSIGSPLDGSLYRSEDGAESWEKVELPPGLNGPNGLKVDSSDSSRLYLASWARNTLEEEKHGGVYISEDRGASWRKVLREDQHIYEVIELLARMELTLVPVLNHEKQYLGVITQEGLTRKFAHLLAMQQPGGIIELEMSQHDYSLSEISQIVESNNGRILSLYVAASEDNTKLRVTLKINLTDLTSILETLNRYNYTVVSSHMSSEDLDEFYQERFDVFLKYLNT